MKIKSSEKNKEKFVLWDYVPIWSFVIYIITIISIALYLIYKNNTVLADFLNDTVGRGIRLVLAYTSNYIPFSLTETLIVGFPILAVICLMIIFKRDYSSRKNNIRGYISYLSVAALVLSSFLLGFQPAFYNPTIDKKMGLTREKVTAEELYDTAMILLEKCEAELDYVSFPMDTYSSMLMTYDELNTELNKAWEKVNDKYDFFQRMNTRIKPVAVSFLWTYTHISGLYSSLTGEANININYPDYIIVTSAAHELAHQRGIGREDEANFCAFLVCSESDNPYLRYAAYLDAFTDVANSLYSADKTENHSLYWSLIATKDERIEREQISYSNFFDKYRSNTAAEITEKHNDTTIKIHGQEEGAKSYGLVVDLLVAYYKN